MEEVKVKLEELEALQKEVDARRKALRDDAIKQVQGIIDRFEIKTSDLRFHDHENGRRNRRGPVQPKYRGPLGELWTGRGRTPKWAERVIANGEPIENYLIRK